MSVFLWWFRQILLSLGALFFLLFGIQLLIAAFGLGNPLWFMMTFFSSTLIILISAAILAGLLYRTFLSARGSSDPGNEPSQDPARGKDFKRPSDQGPA